jgi:hypothetical protein
MNRNMWAPLAGVGFIVVAIIAIALNGEPPDAGDGADEIVSYYLDNKDSIEISSVLAAPAGMFLVFFSAALSRAVRIADELSVLPAVIIVGASFIAIGIAIDSTIQFAIAEAADDIEPASVQTLQALWDNDFIPIAMGVITLLLSSGLAILRTGALPKWLGWVAIVLVVLGLTPAGFIAFLGGAVWIAIVSVMLTLRAREAAPPAATPPVAPTTAA